MPLRVAHKRGEWLRAVRKPVVWADSGPCQPSPWVISAIRQNRARFGSTALISSAGLLPLARVSYLSPVPAETGFMAHGLRRNARQQRRRR
jgi:hypothetical protein